MSEAIKRWRRAKGIPSTEDEMIDELRTDFQRFEASTWVNFLWEYMYKQAQEPFETPEEAMIPEGTIETWLKLDKETQTYVFLYLLGAMYGLLKPPDAGVPALI